MDTEVLFTRQKVIKELSQIRWGGSRTISQPTFWVWCDRCGIPSRQSHFTQEQAQTLCKLALWLREGGNFEGFLQQQIKEQRS